MEMAVSAALVMVIAVIILLLLGAPIGVAIGASSTMAILMILPFKSAAAIGAQKIFTEIL